MIIMTKKIKNNGVDDDVEIYVEVDNNFVIDNNVDIDNDNDNDNVVVSDHDNDNDLDGEYSEEDIVESDLVSGSKKRHARSKKTKDNNFICAADNEFTMMHGPGDFSSLSCNDFNDKITVENDKAKYKKKKKNLFFIFFINLKKNKFR
jgi:hypothetical protein